IDLILSMNSDDWYEQTVDRLLEDPRHGERWARHWMDVWRYSDWWGLGDQLRNSQKHIWHWRDWIVESLNENLPYDEMIRLMLAADELHPNDLEKLRASGFLARNYFLFNRNQWMDETIEHVCKGFLGLTMNCAKCHDHKYDPFTQTNYYELRAIFEPYHVRTDVMPHQSDLNLDGVPRAYDGHLDLPTYVYIRGNEANPDKSVAIKPAVPSFLDSSPFEIQQVALPIESWQPDRRQWVIDANLSVAQTKLDSILATPHDSAEVETVKLSHEVTRTEYDCLKLRIAAMKARWAKSDAASNDGISPESMQTLERAEKESAEAASRSERQLAVLRAKLAIADAE
ncbi:MAG: DUF1549 domain-containing protein, partial [Planctomycetes bacterium]|nr:DUF1549 domain-containing protein [Planctomycetota bacterium]